MNHSITREGHCNHHPIEIIKPVGKLSPLTGVAISENETLTAIFDIYWLNQSGILKLFYKIKVTEASIIDVSATYPHVINSAGMLPHEQILLKYESITWEHKIAGSSGYSIWQDRVY